MAKAPKPETQTTADTAKADTATAQPPALGNDGAATETGAGAQAPAPVTAAKPKPDPRSVEVAEILLGPEGVTILVKGPAKGRWRIGRHFGPEPVAIPASELTVAQIAFLEADPELMVKSMP